MDKEQAYKIGLAFKLGMIYARGKAHARKLRDKGAEERANANKKLAGK